VKLIIMAASHLSVLLPVCIFLALSPCFIAYEYSDFVDTALLGVHTSGRTGANSSDAAASCAHILREYKLLNRTEEALDGLYWIDPLGSGGTSPYQAYCDMTDELDFGGPGSRSDTAWDRRGGGWTLLMKVDGASTTFRYGSGYWRNRAAYDDPLAASTEQLLDPLERAQHKSFAYSEMPISEIRVCTAPVSAFPMAAADYRNLFRCIHIPVSAPSLFDVIQPNILRPTFLGVDWWKSAVEGATLQVNCREEGFNVGQSTVARIGIVGNQEDECTSPDSRIGVGTQGGGCGQDTNIAAGGSSRCGAVGGNKDVEVVAVVFGRTKIATRDMVENMTSYDDEIERMRKASNASISFKEFNMPLTCKKLDTPEYRSTFEPVNVTRQVTRLVLLNETYVVEQLVNGTLVNLTMVNSTVVNGTAVNETIVVPTYVNGTAVNVTMVNSTYVNITVDEVYTIINETRHYYYYNCSTTQLPTGDSVKFLTVDRGDYATSFRTLQANRYSSYFLPDRFLSTFRITPGIATGAAGDYDGDDFALGELPRARVSLEVSQLPGYFLAYWLFSGRRDDNRQAGLVGLSKDNSFAANNGGGLGGSTGSIREAQQTIKQADDAYLEVPKNRATFRLVEGLALNSSLWDNFTQSDIYLENCGSEVDAVNCTFYTSLREGYMSIRTYGEGDLVTQRNTPFYPFSFNLTEEEIAGDEIIDAPRYLVNLGTQGVYALYFDSNATWADEFREAATFFYDSPGHHPYSNPCGIGQEVIKRTYENNTNVGLYVSECECPIDRTGSACQVPRPFTCNMTVHAMIEGREGSTRIDAVEVSSGRTSEGLYRIENDERYANCQFDSNDFLSSSTGDKPCIFASRSEAVIAASSIECVFDNFLNAAGENLTCSPVLRNVTINATSLEVIENPPPVTNATANKTFIEERYVIECPISTVREDNFTLLTDTISDFPYYTTVFNESAGGFTFAQSLRQAIPIEYAAINFLRLSDNSKRTMAVFEGKELNNTMEKRMKISMNDMGIGFFQGNRLFSEVRVKEGTSVPGLTLDGGVTRIVVDVTNADSLRPALGPWWTRVPRYVGLIFIISLVTIIVVSIILCVKDPAGVIRDKKKAKPAAIKQKVA